MSRFGRIDTLKPCRVLRRMASIEAALAVALLLAGQFRFGVGGAEADDTLTRILRAGVVSVGYAGEAPYAYRMPDGRLTGEAIEVGRAVFARMGVRELEGVETEFGQLIRGLNAGRFDVIAAGMFVTPQRCEQVAFSEPSYRIGQAFAVRRGNPKNLHDYDDIVVDREIRLGVVAGTVEFERASRIGLDDGQLLVFPDAWVAADAVKSGRVHAFVGTAPTIQKLVEQQPKLLERSQSAGADAVSGHGAFGFRLTDAAFRDAFDRHLRAFRGSDEHVALIAPFGFTRAELPERSTADLCEND